MDGTTYTSLNDQDDEESKAGGGTCDERPFAFTARNLHTDDI